MQHDIRELERQLADQAAAAQHEARHQAEQAAHTQVRFSNKSSHGCCFDAAPQWVALINLHRCCLFMCICNCW